MPMLRKQPFVAFPCSPTVYVDHNRQASAEIQAVSRRSTLSRPRHALAPASAVLPTPHRTLLDDLPHLCDSLHAPLDITELGTGLLQHCSARSRVQELLSGLQPQQLSLTEPAWDAPLLDIDPKPEFVLVDLDEPLSPPCKVHTAALNRVQYLLLSHQST